MKKEKEMKKSSKILDETKKLNLFFGPPLISKEDQEILDKDLENDFMAVSKHLGNADRRLSRISETLSNHTNVRLPESMVNLLMMHTLGIYSTISNFKLRELDDQLLHFEVENQIHKLGGPDKDDTIIDVDGNEIIDFGHHGSVIIDKDNEHLYPKCNNKTTKTSK